MIAAGVEAGKKARRLLRVDDPARAKPGAPQGVAQERAHLAAEPASHGHGEAVLRACDCFGWDETFRRAP